MQNNTQQISLPWSNTRHNNTFDIAYLLADLLPLSTKLECLYNELLWWSWFHPQKSDFEKIMKMQIQNKQHLPVKFFRGDNMDSRGAEEIVLHSGMSDNVEIIVFFLGTVYSHWNCYRFQVLSLKFLKACSVSSSIPFDWLG